MQLVTQFTDLMRYFWELREIPPKCPQIQNNLVLVRPSHNAGHILGLHKRKLVFQI
jgi:hypothetical protein